MIAMLPLVASGGLSLDAGPFTIVIIVLLFAASFFFSGTETAYYTLQKVDRDAFQRGSATGRQIVRLLERRTLLTTILLGNETVNIALSATCAGLVAAAFPRLPWLNIVLLTPVLVLVSEITPKVLASRYRRMWAQLSVWPLTVIYGLLVIPTKGLFTAFVEPLARLLGADTEVPQGVAQEELMVYVDHGAASGELDPLERDIIEAVFEFDGMTVERLMTPRPDLFSLPLTISWTDLLTQCREAGHSRIPVAGIAEDDIVGVLLLKDLLRFRAEPLAGPRQLRSLLLPPVFVPTSKPADSMLEEFLERRFHMAFVVDEHGTLVGLVTLDDLLGELLGEDEDTDESEVARLRPDALTVKASIDVGDFEEVTGITLPEGDYHTLGGYVFHVLGRLPRKGDSVAFGNNQFVVAKMEGRRIAEVIVRSPDLPDQEAV